MPNYRVTATISTDVYMDIEADNPQEAIDKTELREPGEWLEDQTFSGDFRIDNVFIYDDKGDYHEVSNEVENWRW